MKSVVRISLVALLMAGFAAPASAPARHDDSASVFGKPYYDWCVFPPSLWCDRKNNRWFS